MGLTRIWVGRRQDLLRFGLFSILVAGLALVARALWPAFLSAEPPTAAVMGPALPVVAVAAPAAVRTGGFFSEFRLERDRSRSAQQEVIREVLGGATLDPAVKADATQRYLWLGKASGLESEAEGLIRSLGFSDAIVFLSEGSANVIVRSASLERAQVAQIADIVARTCGVRAQSITVRSRPD